ncbi:MAG: hypothetical protein KAS32_12200 [Candidatus Peribacteraceae bacterium]|nr:hypothetical protein [Candidatus Peribacteraceae bacterium]
MVTIIYGKNKTEGELKGFDPGSNEFSLTLDLGMVVSITPRSQGERDKFEKMRILMNNVGLSKLVNSIIDFNRGGVELVDGPEKAQITQEQGRTAASSFVA